MIVLTRINQEVFVLNNTLIEMIEEIPETKITLTNGKYFLVNESVGEVVEKIIAYNRKVFKDAIKLK